MSPAVDAFILSAALRVAGFVQSTTADAPLEVRQAFKPGEVDRLIVARLAVLAAAVGGVIVANAA